MTLPRLGQYQLALQHPVTAFADLELKRAVVECTPLGLPRVISGGFALTYHLTNGRSEWAVRCFHREASGLARRYDAISRMVAAAPRAPFVPVQFLPRGVQVEGTWYPVTKMPWLPSTPLNRYIELHLEPRALTSLAAQFRRLTLRLEQLGVAHGDLQHGNILVDGRGSPTLVDYDGMYVPALAGLSSNEGGHINYQHPGRTDQFDATLDRFSAAVIYTALTALAADPSLWSRYSNGENLLFRRADFDDPAASPLFRELAAYTDVAPLAAHLQSLCRGAYDDVPSLDAFIAGGVPVTAATRTPDRAAAAPTQFAVIDANDSERLLHHEGDVVTVIGRIRTTQQRWSRQRRPYVSLTLGSEDKRETVVVLWSEALNFFMPTGQVITAYNGSWIRATGLVSITHRRDAARTPRAMLTINLPSDVRILREEDARALLAGHELPWYRANHRPRAIPSPPVTARAAATLNHLYGAPPPDRIPTPVATSAGERRAGGSSARSSGGKDRTKKPAGARKPATTEWWRHFLPATLAPGQRTPAATLTALSRHIAFLLIKVTVVALTAAIVSTVLIARLLW